MRIWVDLANSPQVLFFLPILKELRRRGHRVVITTREFAQTRALADHYGLEHTPVGEHGGTALSRIGYSLLQRAWRLVVATRSQHFDLAVSHNSYAQALAAFARRIPFVTLMDYEHQPANHLCFRLARRVIVPEVFPRRALRRFGVAPARVRYYRGLKEQVYLSDFAPGAGYLRSMGIPEERIVVTMRPPGSWGLYHHFDNPLFERVLEHVAACPDTFIVFLPRISAQAEVLRTRRYGNVLMPTGALDGPELISHSDLVISGGGTMNREAGILGTPAYSVFKGKLAAVDRHLMDLGRMIHVACASEIDTIKVEKRVHRHPLTNAGLVAEITGAILDARTKA